MLEGGLVAVVGARRVPDVAAGGRARLGGRRARSPCVVGLAAPEGAAAHAAVGLRTGDLGGRVPERGADLVDLQLDGGALLAFLGLVGTLLETPGSDDPGTLGE